MDRGEPLEFVVRKQREISGIFFIWKRKSSDSQLNFDTRKRGYVINKGREEKGGKKKKIQENEKNGRR